LKQNWVDSDDLAMMYRATYVPEFYRALHALVHNEFRSWKLIDELTRALGRPSTLRPRQLRRALALAGHILKQPILRRRVDRLERLSPPPTKTVPLAVMTPRMAAIPSDQSKLTVS
jgi:anaerobic magnesium-protoporphyrin IX monomethyl ester cyclase